MNFYLHIGRFSFSYDRGLLRPSRLKTERADDFDWEAHSRQMDRRYAWQERLQKRMSA